MLRELNMPNLPDKLLAKYGFHLGLPDEGLATETYGLSQIVLHFCSHISTETTSAE